jgi:chorismate-pyruvate lyase
VGPTADQDGFTRFQRMLLSTDGTVTRLLETYAGEPIEVVKLRQELDVAGPGDEPLCLAAGDSVLRRHVVLRGRRSRQNLLYAEAVVVPVRVDRGFLDALLATDVPIGALLAEHRMETFRENLVVARERAGRRGAHFGVDAGAELIYRTYRIVARGVPVILITEKFPAGSFRQLPM